MKRVGGIVLTFVLIVPVIAVSASSAPDRASATVFRCPGGELFDRQGHHLSATGDKPAAAPSAGPEGARVGATTGLTVLPWVPMDYASCQPTSA
jgi:hypothetical protein